MMRWALVVISGAMLLATSCQSEDIESAQVRQIKDILKEVHGQPRKILTVSEEVSKLRDIAEPTLISMFKDQQIDNYKWRLEAAILLIAMKSGQGIGLVKRFMGEIAEIALIEEVGKRKDTFGKKLGTRDVVYFLYHFDEIMAQLQDITLYKKMLYAGHIPQGSSLDATLIKQKPKETIPVVIAFIAGEESYGRRPDNYGRLELSHVIVKMQDYLDKDARAKAKEAIKKLNEEAYDGREEELINLLKELKE